MFEFISLGAGRQSTSLIIANVEGLVSNPTNTAIFADTGSERPETIEYLETYLKPYCKRVGFELITVRRQDYFPEEYNSSLEAYCLHKKIVPSAANRWCTDKFKLIPIDKYLSDKYYQPIAQVGIALEERHRAHVEDTSKRYPLLELGWTTDDCIDLIVKAGLPVPPKSGCYFCHFQKKREWLELDRDHPDLADRALALEANAVSKKYPGKKKNLPLFGNLANFYLNSRNQMILPGNWQGLTDAELEDMADQELTCSSYGSCMR